MLKAQIEEHLRKISFDVTKWRPKLFLFYCMSTVSGDSFPHGLSTWVVKFLELLTSNVPGVPNSQKYIGCTSTITSIASNMANFLIFLHRVVCPISCCQIFFVSFVFSVESLLLEKTLMFALKCSCAIFLFSSIPMK